MIVKVHQDVNLGALFLFVFLKSLIVLVFLGCFYL